VRDGCSPGAGYDALSRIELPAGSSTCPARSRSTPTTSVVRGAGSNPATGTRIVFRPDEDTRYDTLTDDGGDWDEDGMTHDDGKGGWLWPGRGLFRVQSRQVDDDYAEAYESAPANRRDLFEGTVNVHWKAGVELRERPNGHDGFAARAGDDVVFLAEDADLDRFTVGGWVNVRAANTMAFYEQQQALKASPLVDPVVGVGFEGFHFGQVIPDGDPADAEHEYGNLAPAYEMHGIVFKWAVDGWVRDTASYMTGSHPIVTEEAKNLQIEGNWFQGAWNKGKGGNGYLRGSRVWDSLYVGNVLRGLRHTTFQWSASGNVFIGNDTDSDLNLHGGWERENLFDNNVVQVPYEHRPGNCTAHCGGEGGAGDEGDDAIYDSFPPYSPDTLSTVFVFGWSGTSYQHLAGEGGDPIADWAGHETDDFTGSGGGVVTLTAPGPSLFLEDLVPGPVPVGPTE